MKFQPPRVGELVTVTFLLTLIVLGALTDGPHSVVMAVVFPGAVGALTAFGLSTWAATRLKRPSIFVDRIRIGAWSVTGAGFGVSACRPFYFQNWRQFLNTIDLVSGIMFYGGLVVLILTWTWWRPPKPPGPGRCQTCGYDLFGLTEPRCPECGTRCDLPRPEHRTNGATQR